MEQKTACYWN